MFKDRLRQIAVLVSTLMMITVSSAAGLGMINDVSTAEIAQRLNILIIPASYAFAIWGVIYVGLLLLSIYQVLPANREIPVLRKAGWWMVMANTAQITWIISWHYQSTLLALAMMIFMLTALIMIYLHLEIGVSKTSNGMRWMVHLPISIFIAWITGAVIGNVGDYLYHAKWHGFGLAPEIWAVAMLVLGAVISEMVAYNRRDIAFLAVMVWAFVAIGVKTVEVSPIFEAACVAAVVVSIMGIVSLIFKRKVID